MKYGESAFDVLYLLFEIAAGIIILVKSRTRTERLMGYAPLLLGVGDAFHLVPRVLNYFIEADFTAALGIGKLVTSITMTGFYVLMYYIWLGVFGRARNRNVSVAVWMLAAARVVLCVFPQNHWAENIPEAGWVIYRNIPFLILGMVIMALWYFERKSYKRFRFTWLLVLLSFFFYIPAAVGSGKIPMLGMLMIPKTICYVLIAVTFLLAVTKDKVKKRQ